MDRWHWVMIGFICIILIVLAAGCTTTQRPHGVYSQISIITLPVGKRP